MTVRHRLSLDGTWDFVLDDSERLPASGWRQVQVPMPWQAQHADLRDQAGTGWYRRSFDAGPPAADEIVVIGFGAVDYLARVWVNSVEIGSHEGGYLPFEFEVGDVLRGHNELVVQVIDPTDDPVRFRDGAFSEIPHGKQSWYGPISGIWQSVWLERRPRTHLRSISIRAEADGHFDAEVALSSEAPQGCTVHLDIRNPDDVPVAMLDIPLAPGSRRGQWTATIDGARVWSAETPDLHVLTAELVGDGVTIDRLTEPFGFRTIETRDGGLWLNGKPLYLRAALDQDYYPDTIATPPSVEYLEDQVRKAKEMGLNCLRCHIKVPDPRYLEVADRLGILVWLELPNWRRFSPAAAARARATLEGMLARDRNRPSVIAWTIVNEDWGTDLVNESSHRAWLRDTYQWLKEADPTRLVIDNSACPPNFHVVTDVEDFHFYRAYPDQRLEWDELMTNFASRPDWTFAPDGGERRGDEPLIVSEFGVWGLPEPSAVSEAGEEPWWFETGQEWEPGVVYPHGFSQRVRRWHLNDVFGDPDGFARATQWHQYNALKYQIEEIRSHDEISGYVVTELADAFWEANGLLDIHRQPKAFHHAIAGVNGETTIIPRCERAAFWAGEEAKLSIRVAHGGPLDFPGGRLRWRAGDQEGEGAVPSIASRSVAELAPVSIRLPRSAGASVTRVSLEVIDPDGEGVASSHLDLTALAPRETADLDRLAIWAVDANLGDRLTALGYRLVPTVERAEVAVAHHLDASLESWVRAGGRAILLVASDGEIFSGGPAATTRAGTVWEGSWATAFSWLRRDGAFGTIPGGPLLDQAFDRVTPPRVLTGFWPWQFEAHVDGGIVVGWAHKPAVVLGTCSLGDGELMLTTFELLNDAPEYDPVATRLLDGMIGRGASSRAVR